MPKYIKVERSDMDGAYIEELKDIPGVLESEFDDIEYIQTGVQVILTVVEMSQDEYESLTEFMGW